MKKTALLFVSAVVLAALSGAASAAACTSVATGNWSAQTTWGAAGTGCAGAPGGIPGANDTVTIANLAHTVTITDTRQIGNLTMAAGNLSTTLQLQNGAQLSVIVPGPGVHDVVIGAPSANGVTKLVQLLSNSTLIVGRNVSITGGGAATRNAEVRVEGGSTLTVGRDVQLNNDARSLLTFLAAGTLNLARHMRQTGTFSCPACTVNFTGVLNQNIAGTPSGYTYFNLVDQKTGSTATFLEDTTIAGSITDNGNLDLVGNGPIVTLSGNAAQAISGSAATTSFDSLVMAKTVGTTVILSHDIDMATDLTLTTGIISTGTNTVVLPAGVTLTGGSANSYVSGCLLQGFKAGDPLNFRAAGLDEFPVGIAGSYLPIEITAGTTSTAGTLRVCANAGDHPQMTLAAGGGIDTAKSLNRYWSMTNTGLNTSAVRVNAIFKFPNGATEYDAGATPGNFIVERYDGVNWNPTTLVTAALTSTRAQNINLTAGTDDFAIGEPLAGFNATPGAFNAFETATPAGAVLGRTFTKLAGTNFTLSVVAVVNNGVNAAPSTNQLTINVVDATGTPGVFSAATNCWSGWPSVGAGTTVAAAVGWAAGRINVTITAPATAVRNARIRVTQAGTGATGCSTDNFSIRPAKFTVTSTDATNTGTSGTPSIKTGANFNLTAAAVNLANAAVTGYDGTPAVDNTKIVGTPTAGTIGGSFTAATPATGIASGAAFTYSEVGNFGVNTNAVFDSGFTGVDPSNDCTADFSNALVGGKYGCSFGSTAVTQTTGSSGFGRFIPDHFFLAVGSTLINRSAASCAPASSFSYMGEGMALAFTLQARNSSAIVTQNYVGAYAKLNPATIAQLGFGAVNGATNLTPRLDLSAGSAGSFASGQAAVTATVGITRAVPDDPDGPFTAARIGIAPSDSDSVTARTADMNMDVDGVAGNDHVQVGANTELRFGRLRMQNASGSGKIVLPVPIETQYWTGTAFATNTLDNCTSLPRNVIELGSYTGNITPSPNCLTFVQQNPVSFVSGVGTLRLAAPTGGASGSVLLTPNLGATTTGNYCSAAGVAPAGPTAAAGLSYLLGRWNDASNPDGNPNTNYDDKPAARAAFGLYGSQPKNFIFQRENY